MALWVVFYHYGVVPLSPDFGRTPGIAELARFAYNNLFSGPAAVIAFFVISGCCIHYPRRHDQRIDLFSFYARRQVRILIPVLGALALAVPLHLRASALFHGVLWNLVCEEIYYTLYPALRLAGRRYGWGPVVLASFGLAAALAASSPHELNYQAFGALNWVLGLPCWLLGVMLAESADAWLEARRAPSTREIWSWRAGVFAASLACGLLRHIGLGYPWTLNLFALLMLPWIGREIARAQAVGVGLLERAGAFSYSIYLMHGHAELFWRGLGLGIHEPVNGILRNAFILSSALLFYLAVERPAHRLARRIQARVVGVASVA